MKKSFRKRSVETAADEDTGDKEAAEKLREVKEQQKARALARLQGVSAEELLRNSDGTKASTSESAVDAATKPGLRQGAPPTDPVDSTQRMERYIEAKLREEMRKGSEPNETTATPETGEEKEKDEKEKVEAKGATNGMDDLFKTPEHLKAETTKKADDKLPLPVLTGIPEVQLPDRYRLQNEAATEKARQKLLADHSAGDRGKGQHGTGDSMVRHHKRYRDMGDRVPSDAMPQRQSRATDNAVAERFRQRFLSHHH